MGQTHQLDQSTEKYLGVWELDPATLDYQHGRPGLRAVYTIRAIPEGLEFDLDADGKPMHVIYGGKLDGIFRPLPGYPASLALTLLDDGRIESAAMVNGAVVDRWTREIEEGGQALLIRQHGADPSGNPFTNSGVYRRVKQAPGAPTGSLVWKALHPIQVFLTGPLPNRTNA